jgi:hypothetical protein
MFLFEFNFCSIIIPSRMAQVVGKQDRQAHQLIENFESS